MSGWSASTAGICVLVIDWFLFKLQSVFFRCQCHLACSFQFVSCFASLTVWIRDQNYLCCFSLVLQFGVGRFTKWVVCRFSQSLLKSWCVWPARYCFPFVVTGDNSVPSASDWYSCLWNLSTAYLDVFNCFYYIVYVRNIKHNVPTSSNPKGCHLPGGVVTAQISAQERNSK